MRLLQRRRRRSKPPRDVADIVIEDRLSTLEPDLHRDLAEALRLDPPVRAEPLTDPVLERIQLQARWLAGVFLPPRMFRRTVYRPSEFVQSDLWEAGSSFRLGMGRHPVPGSSAGRCAAPARSPPRWSSASGTLHSLRLGEEPVAAWSVAREAGLGAGKRRSPSVAAEPSRSGCPVGSCPLASRHPRAREIWRRRARLSDRTGSCGPASSRAACSRTTSTSRIASTPGPTWPTSGAPHDPPRPDGAARRGSGVRPLPARCGAPSGARRSGCRRSSSGLIAATTRSNRCSSVAASSSACRGRRPGGHARDRERSAQV